MLFYVIMKKLNRRKQVLNHSAKNDTLLNDNIILSTRQIERHFLSLHPNPSKIILNIFELVEVLNILLVHQHSNRLSKAGFTLRDKNYRSLNS